MKIKFNLLSLLVILVISVNAQAIPVTFHLDANDTQYKTVQMWHNPDYLNFSDEFTASASSTIAQLHFNIGAENAEFWFDNISLCEVIESTEFVNVTFRVDMINEVVSSSGVHLNGSFCNWSTADAVELTAAGTVYMTTLQLKKGETIEYKFVNGASDDWLKYETITGDCGYSQDNNRMIIVPENDVTLDLVCFEKCNACEPVAESDFVAVTFRVNMINEVVSASGVHLNGSFCNWSTADAVELTAAGTVYMTTLQLKKGETIEYKFVNGASDDWLKYETITGDCGYSQDNNRMIIVPENDVTLDLVCFEKCNACEPVAESDFVAVTFRVNMINEVVSASGVHLNGSFCNWSTADAVELTAAGTVYMTTLQLKKGETIEYKFVNGASDDWLKYETITGDCGYSQDNNRMIIVPENDVTLDLVCFEKCNACEPVAESDFVAVTFRVNMINEVVSASGVHINGNFCNWSTADAVELTAAGTVYMTTLQLKKGETIEYKFVNGASDDWLKYETITGDCGYSQDNNRMIIVPENDVTLDLVCFEKCNACEPVAESDFVAVTFRVNMINEVVSASGVHLNGSFCNWSTADAVELTAAGTVYMTTLQLKKGETIEYKFVNGASDDWLKYETINGDCGYSQDNNRMIIVPENDVTLDLVCFEKCNACETSSIDCVMVESIKLFPNPTDGCFSISGLPEEQIQVSIYNSEGKLIFQTNTECRNTLTSELGNYPSGIYILSIKNTNNNELASYKLIKE